MSKVIVKDGIVSSVERLNNSMLGNPNWLITFEDGTSNRTSVNRSISHWIGSHVVGKAVSVVLTPAGRITDVSVVHKAPESGVRPCACRDCPDIVYGNVGDLCWACEEAGCEPLPDRPFLGMMSMFECQREDAYGE